MLAYGNHNTPFPKTVTYMDGGVETDVTVVETDATKQHCGVDMLNAHVCIGDTVVAATGGSLHVYYVDSSDKTDDGYVLVPIVRLGDGGGGGRTPSAVQAWHRVGKKVTIFRPTTSTVKVDLGRIRVHL